jgi:MFS family permease
VGVVPAFVTLWIQHDVPEPVLWQRNIQSGGATRAEKRTLWRSQGGRLSALFAMNTFAMFAWWGLFTWIPAYLVLPATKGGRDFGMAGSTAFLMILNLCGMLPGYLLFGVLADKFGRKATIIGYLALAAISVPPFALARDPELLVIAAIVTAFFGTGFFTGSGILGSELFPTPIRATALGISYNAARGVSAIAPAVIGKLAESRGISGAFAISAVAFALAAISAVFVPETRGTALS